MKFEGHESHTMVSPNTRHINGCSLKRVVETIQTNIASDLLLSILIRTVNNEMLSIESLSDRRRASVYNLLQFPVNLGSPRNGFKF